MTETKKPTGEESEASPTFTTANVDVTTEKMKSQEKEEEQEEVEEDWSNIMINEDDGGFGRHEESEEFVLSNGVRLKIVFTSSLTPLDMIDLSWGTNDATGHCIWTGARYFLLILPNLSQYFVNKNVLELGCGTGLSGIAVVLQHPTNIKSIVLTDSSKSVLKLCQRNCEINNVLQQQQQNDDEESSILSIEELSWGSSLDDRPKHQQQKRQSPILLFDTVFATDVLYDIGSWLPLLQTVRMSIKEEGTFILSHVPRAALPTKSKTAATTDDGNEEWSSLEDYLIETANDNGFDLITTFRPTTTLTKNNDDGSSNDFVEQQQHEDRCLGEEEDSFEKKDVAIYIFQKKSTGVM